MGSTGDINYDGCQNNACVLQPDGTWKIWSSHTPVKGEKGAYGYANQGDTNDFGDNANTISRIVYLPSISEVSSIVNVNDQYDMDKFLRNESDSYIHMWFRDSRGSSRANAMVGYYIDRSLNDDHVRYAHITVRPAYVIDLEAYQSSQTN